MQKRQEAFLSALIRNPSLAHHVQNFSWTLRLLDSNRRTTLGIDPFAINRSVVLDPKSPFNEIWKAFASLISVRTLDLAWLSRHLAMPLIHSIPSALFPAATSVRPVGVMPSVLAADHLDDADPLENVLNGITVSRVPRRDRQIQRPPAVSISILPHRQTRQSWNNLSRFRNDSEYFNAPGPIMQNLLGALAGKCTSLTSLHLRKKHDIYAEWAVFLASVKPTLESSIFEQGERLLPQTERAQPPVRPMDQLFGDGIFPVLTGAGVGRWPRMKEVVIRGVQQWKENDGQGSGEMVLVDGRGKLGGAFGGGVKVVIRREAREADHLGVGYG
ncbi:MAG: hypothetical protein ALECFALPRED_001919 [Alectoria fallacina]|uniref:Uncharacterized protein n=1 Tax=Alectoria fallacina TaxID=1903189 RepID=A0A8H3EK41_9LECA|nr:MAG: hypothetical protein ALECFALPRED_001919 [Alectoria fallacina]